MPKFNIVKIDPNHFKQDIQQLWNDYLPGTPPDRFEWMNSNPAGPPDWFFAMDADNETVTGMISIMPKWFNILGQRCRTGMVGDFVVKKEYQVFGPSIALLKSVIEQRKKLDYSFLYTLPNPNAAAVCLRGGFAQIAVTDRFVKILCPGNKIAGHLPKAIRSLSARLLDFGYKLISKETYMNPGLSAAGIENVSQMDGYLVAEPTSAEFSKGEQYLDYLGWRYFNNPIGRIKAELFQKDSAGTLIGKIIYATTNSRIHIYDFWSRGMGSLHDVLAQIIKNKRKEGYESISIRMIEDAVLTSDFKRHGFVARKEKMPILFSGGMESIPGNWHFFDGDRNI